MADRHVYQQPAIENGNFDLDLFSVFQRDGADYGFKQTSLNLAAKHLGFTGQVVHTITSAELLALNATEQVVVPAPGEGFALVPILWAARKTAGTAYAGIAAGEDLALKYTDDSGDKAAVDIETTGFLDQTTAQIRVAPGGVGLAAAVAPVANAPLVVHLLSGEIITGDTDLEVLVRYTVIPTDFAG